LLEHNADPARAKAAYVAELSRHLTQEAREVVYDVRLKEGSGLLTDQLHVLLTDWGDASGVRTALRVRGHIAPMPLHIQYELLRIAEEALTNVQRHAHASHVVMEVDQTGSGMTLSLRDDGQGFLWAHEWQALAQDGHFGLLGMRERAAHVGARLQIVTS